MTEIPRVSCVCARVALCPDARERYTGVHTSTGSRYNRASGEHPTSRVCRRLPRRHPKRLVVDASRFNLCWPCPTKVSFLCGISRPAITKRLKPAHHCTWSVSQPTRRSGRLLARICTPRICPLQPPIHDSKPYIPPLCIAHPNCRCRRVGSIIQQPMIYITLWECDIASANSVSSDTYSAKIWRYPNKASMHAACDPPLFGWHDAQGGR